MKNRPVEAEFFHGDKWTDVQRDRRYGPERRNICSRKVDNEFCLQAIIKYYLHERKMLNFMEIYLSSVLDITIDLRPFCTKLYNSLNEKYKSLKIASESETQ
jgi:hypothetical protein